MFEEQYIQILAALVQQGERVETRNGPVRKLPFLNVAFDARYLPLLHSRKTFYKGIAGEYAAFLRGPHTKYDFRKFGCNYWDDWADEYGDLNVDYGNAWIDFNGVNQIDNVIDSIRNDPHGRRHIISGWDPSNLESLSLPCCHHFYQFYVRDNNYLDLLWNQRSVDWAIGCPADAVLATIMLHTFANATGYKAGVVKMSFGDCHVYENHIEQAQEQLARVAQMEDYELIEFSVKNRKKIYDFIPADVVVSSDYKPMKAIKYELNI